MQKQLEKILYLEDDPSIAAIVQLTLKMRSGYNVKHCPRGQEAVDAFEDFAPDLLLFDVMLPDMDGVQTLAKIRKKKGGRDVPVIFMTAKAQVHEQKIYQSLGALGVIVKPFEAFTLGDTLATLWANDDVEGENANVA